MHVRDTQKNKVYKAERASIKKLSRYYDELEGVQEFIRVILKDEWFRSQYPHVKRIKATWGKGQRWSYGNYDFYRQPWMRLAKKHWCDWVVLHELAHGLQPAGTAFHGKEFCSIYSRLVYRFMGPEAFRALTDAFREARVQYIWMSGSGCGLAPYKASGWAVAIL